MIIDANEPREVSADARRILALNITKKWSSLNCLDLDALNYFLIDEEEDEFSHLPSVVAGKQIDEIPWEDLVYGDYLFPLHVVDADMKMFLFGSMMIFLLRERNPSGRRDQAENVVAVTFGSIRANLNDEQMLWFREFIGFEKEVKNSTLGDMEISQDDPPTMEAFIKECYIHPFDSSVAMFDVIVSQLKEKQPIDFEKDKHYLRILFNEIQNMSIYGEDAWSGEYGRRAEYLIIEILRMVSDDMLFECLSVPERLAIREFLKRNNFVDPETHPRSASLILKGDLPAKQ